MPRVAQPTRGHGITDTIGHQEIRVETIRGKNMDEEKASMRVSEKSPCKREDNMQCWRETQLVSAGEKPNYSGC